MKGLIVDPFAGGGGVTEPLVTAPAPTRPTRPAMRYHGGKWRLAPWIIAHFPPAHVAYVEPYGGGASVLLRKPRSHAEVYNDLDGDVVNVFRVLQDREKAERFRELCHLTPWSRDEFELSIEPAGDDVEQARRTVARTFLSHGNTSRSEKRSGFRARNGRSRSAAAMDWVNWPDQVPAFVERLRGVTIERRPALRVIEQQDAADTLFYLDPPYVQSTRSAIRWPSDVGRCYLHEMSDADHRQLAAALNAIEGMAVLSGYRCDLYDELYADWKRTEKHAAADAGLPRTECLWLNPAASAALEVHA